MQTCVIIPAYNEAPRIGQVLKSLTDSAYDLIVVDDGSTDATATIAAQFPLTLLTHAVNLGQGAALKTGTDYAIRQGYDRLIHFDADGQHRISDLSRLNEALDTHEIVIGSRFLEAKTEFPWSKKVIYKFATIFSKKILKLNFTDPQCGFRALRLSAAQKLNWQKNNFEHCSEILGLILKNRLSYLEIPIIVDYDDYSQSKLTKPSLSLGWKLILSKFLD